MIKDFRLENGMNQT